MVSRNRTQLWKGALLLSLLIPSVAAALTEFSADLTYYDRENRAVVSGRLYVTDDAIREERQRGGAEEVRIIDLFRGTTTVVDPQRSEFELRNEVLVLPRNPVQFCSEAPLLVCQFQQQEWIDGRSTERWAADLGFTGFNITVTAWYDPQIQYPVRVQLDSGGYLQLSGIESERQPSALFSLPFGSSRVPKVEGVEIENFSVWP